MRLLLIDSQWLAFKKSVKFLANAVCITINRLSKLKITLIIHINLVPNHVSHNMSRGVTLYLIKHVASDIIVHPNYYDYIMVHPN